MAVPVRTHNVPLQGLQSQTQQRLDLSNVISSLDNFRVGDSISTQSFRVKDVDFWIWVFPKGETEPHHGSCSVYLHSKSQILNDSRLISFSLRFGEETKSIPRNYVSAFAKGRGWAQAVNLLSGSIRFIDITVQFLDAVTFPTPKQSFEEQLEAMYRFSNNAFNVKLVVQNDKADADGSVEPPRKRRRLNGSGSAESAQDELDSENEPRGEITVSSAILQSASPVFAQMLSADMKESREKEIVVHAQSLKDVQDLVRFMFTNKLKADANLLELMPLAHLYQMDRLFWACVDKLVKGLSLETYVRTVKTFNRYQVKQEQGFKLVADFGRSNLEALRKRDDFDDLPHMFKCFVLGTN